MGSAGNRADVALVSAPSPREVETALAAVLASPQFRNSLQCSSFLRYVVKHSLSGEDHLLRERVIGHEVFHRAAGYDTGEDPVVRVRAAEVRKRLAQFYQGSPSELQIEVPSGSYRALFHVWDGAAMPGTSAAPVDSLPVTAHMASATPVESQEAAVLPEAAASPPEIVVGPQATPAQAEPLAPARKRWRQWIALVASTAALAGGATYLGLRHVSAHDRVEREFWAPWTDVHRPVLIAMGSNAVYRLAEPVSTHFAQEQAGRTQGLEVFPSPQDLAKLKGDSFVPAEDSFVALGDVVALADVVRVLAHHDQHFQERFPNDIAFAELRDSPTILIGGYNNPTNLEMTKGFRFRLTGHNEIVDAQTPGRKWELHASLDSHDTEDYALLTRTLQSTDAPLLSVAGMGGYGTQCAAEFITNPDSLAELSKSVGRTWQQKNFQIVLHVHIHDFKPGKPEVVAAYSW